MERKDQANIRPAAKDPVADLPEVFLSTSAITNRVSALASQGRVRKIGPRLYTTDVRSNPADVVRRHLWHLVGLCVPGAVVSYRTAFEGRPADDGTVYVVAPAVRIIALPGLTIRVVRGPGPLDGDQSYIASLFLASRPRLLLEGLTLTRTRGAHTSRAISRATAEEYLSRELQLAGEERLNAIRDQARAIAPALDAVDALAILDGIIGTLLGTRNVPLATGVARAHVSGQPYDPGRIALFHTLHAALRQRPVGSRPERVGSLEAFRVLSFFDAYFSNFIEGTEFEVDEARQIVFEGKIPAQRPQDAHDVLGTYRLVGSPLWMAVGVLDTKSVDAYLDRMRRAHADLMALRPAALPGEFKRLANRAGATPFVAPALVSGTLRYGVELAQSLDHAFSRAVLLKFVIAEVHPFTDGNGRVARALMNAELSAGGEQRLLIPTVYREEYLTGLRALSRTQYPDALIEVLEYAQAFTARIPFGTYVEAETALRAAHAFEGGGGAGSMKLRMPPEPPPVTPRCEVRQTVAQLPK